MPSSIFGYLKSLPPSVHRNGDRLTIPLNLRGIMSGFESVKPTLEDLDSLEPIHLTADMPWRPMSTHFEDEEDAAQRRSAKTATTRSGNPVDNDHRVIAAVRSFGDIGHCLSIADNAFPLDPCLDDFSPRLVASVQVHYTNAKHDTEDWCPQPRDKCPDDGDVAPWARSVAKLITSVRESVLTPQILSQRWNIGLLTAKKTLDVTTQSGLRNIYAPAERKLRQRTQHLRFPTLRGKFYTDTGFSNIKSMRGFKGFQTITNGKGYDRFYPHVSKGQAGAALTSFIQTVGIPQTLVCDNAPELTGPQSEMGKVCRAHHIEVKTTVPHQPWRNLAEAAIREGKESVRRMLRQTQEPKRGGAMH